MAGEKVLIIEDDPALLRGLKDNFESKDYLVTTAVDGEEGLEAALGIKPDLIILDIMLPKINGYEVCRLIRKEELETVIIMLTAKGQESDVILGLNLGADDYVTKPFSIQELLARANAFLRRRKVSEGPIYRFGNFELNSTSHQLLRDGTEVQLTPKEYALLALLVKRPGRAFTRDDILRSVWGHDIFVTNRSVDRCITTLRNKIETDPRRPIFINTVREIGYRFEIPEEPPRTL
ncbi:MAG: response regulator transcription factor [Planctomycetota bacterium]|jgi:DNA-binding response OmpR family regulator